LSDFFHGQQSWNNVNADIEWWAPGRLYWICGKTAYAFFPWAGQHLECWGQFIRPSSCSHFLGGRDLLGAPVYESWEAQRRWCALQISNWKDDKWPPEHIIHSYGPATWEQEVSWKYRTPTIYWTVSSGYRLLLKL
jgi:hypothetical protein